MTESLVFLNLIFICIHVSIRLCNKLSFLNSCCLPYIHEASKLLQRPCRCGWTLPRPHPWCHSATWNLLGTDWLSSNNVGYPLRSFEQSNQKMEEWHFVMRLQNERSCFHTHIGHFLPRLLLIINQYHLYSTINLPCALGQNIHLLFPCQLCRRANAQAAHVANFKSCPNLALCNCSVIFMKIEYRVPRKNKLAWPFLRRCWWYISKALKMPILFDIAIPSLEIPHFIPCQGNNQKWSQRFVNQEICLRHTDQKIKIKTKVKQIGVG